jgi:arylsulfatase A-like enzyme
MISNVDLTPTILDMLGIKLPDNLHGHSFAGLFRASPYQSRNEIYAEKTFHTAYEPQRAVRSGRYKLIWNAEVGILNVPGDVIQSPIYPQMIPQAVIERPSMELYDLNQDPMEMENLIQNPEYAEVRKDLSQRLLNWMQETDDPLLKGPIASPFYQQGLESLKAGSA